MGNSIHYRVHSSEVEWALGMTYIAIGQYNASTKKLVLDSHIKVMKIPEALRVLETIDLPDLQDTLESGKWIVKHFNSPDEFDFKEVVSFLLDISTDLEALPETAQERVFEMLQK